MGGETATGSGLTTGRERKLQYNAEVMSKFGNDYY